MIAETPLTVPVESGVDLEARLAIPSGASAGFVMCHPHPLYGGDMDNPVVVRAVEVAQALGLATMRFNFRGVGDSTGTHGGGTAEQRDLESAIDRLRADLPSDAPMIVGGYSFGSIVAAHVIARERGDALALVAPPIGVSELRRLPDLPRDLPTIVVVGTNDEYCPADAIERLRKDLSAARLDVIDGANHFFFGKMFPLGEALRAWIPDALRARQAGRRGGAG